MKIYITLAASILLAASCGTNSDKSRSAGAEVWTVGSEMVDCIGVTRQRCYIVKPEGAADWQLFYSPILDFEWEPGYEYVISLRKETVSDPPMDASSLRYTLDRVLSKERRTSENIPDTSHMFNE